VYVNGAAVVPLDAVRTSDGSVVEALVVALRDVGGRGMLSGRTGRREVTVLADRDLPYSVMRRIMASASAADYTAVSLAVIEKSRAGAAPG
jgi:biopolymer transport protein ExbD